MMKREVIGQLESLLAYCKTMLESGKIWERDCEALNIALATLCGPESLRPRAHWEKEIVDGPDVVKYTSLFSIFCSRCERRTWTKSNYFPHCGARMED